ncbi:hypothetical protein HYV73_03595 [Candidatus Uhrbacteria bacterium]|nr:hypothetical protein [Candidatus Uhrbacteria bacterium]
MQIQSAFILAAGDPSSVFEGLDTTAGTAGYDVSVYPDITIDIRRVMDVILGLLGIILFFLLMYGGFMYLTAAGDEKKTQKGKDTVRTAIMGLVIVVAAYAIVSFLFDQLFLPTGNQGDIKDITDVLNS